MKRLTLFRHGKSSWDEAGPEDFDRPLAPRGRRDVPEMAQRLASRHELPDLIVTSPARRALSSARMAARVLGYPEARLIEEPGLYLADAGRILRIVRSLASPADHLMLLGHNPGFNELANTVPGVRLDNLPTAGLFCAAFDVADWGDVESARGRFVYLDFPKNDRGRPCTRLG